MSLRLRSRSIPALLAALAIAPVLRLGAQTPKFEGVVSIVLTNNGIANEAQYSVKGDMVRMDISMGGMLAYMLMTPSDGKMVVVMPMQRMYMEQSMDTLMARAGVGDKGPAVKWTGKKETIAGYQCEHATVTGPDGKSADACITKELGTFTMPSGPMSGGRRSEGWQGGLGPEMFPLKVTVGTDVAFEVTRVEKKTLDASLFSLPTGYQKMQMPGRPSLN